MQCYATCHCPQWPKVEAESMACWGQKEQKVLLSETPLPPPLPCGDIRPHSLTQEGQVCLRQISSQEGRPVPRSFLGEALWRRRPMGWEATRRSPLAWPLCRCHSGSCGSVGAWRYCQQGRALHLTGQGQGTSSSWWGCRERGMRSQRNDIPNLQHHSL